MSPSTKASSTACSAELEAAAERSPLPELPAGRADLNALLLSLRGVGRFAGKLLLTVLAGRVLG